MELLEEIKEWFETHRPQSNSSLFRKLQSDINKWEEIYNYTEFLPKDCWPSQRIWHYYMQKKEIPKCIICEGILSFRSFGENYPETCSKSCTAKKKWKDGKMNEGAKKGAETFRRIWGKDGERHKELLQKIKTTNNLIYGTNHPMQNKEFIEARKNECLEKYGVDNYAKLDSVKKKLSNTWTNKPKEVQEEINKRKREGYLDTIHTKYGEEYNTVYAVPEIQEIMKNTNLEKRGVEYNFQSKEVQDKSKATSLERYGYENPMQNIDIQKIWFESCVNLKEYILPSGKMIKYQGYLNKALDILFLDYKEDDIDIEFDCPRIKYELDNIEHYYRPDAYIKSKNTIIEVKSIFTFYQDLEKNIIKMKSSIDNGYNFEFWIYIKV